MAENPSNQGVYFLSLSVENVRCFAEKQTLDLSDGSGRPAQWTVILGDNGTGKSTLLDALTNSKQGIRIKQSLARNPSINPYIEFTYSIGNGLKFTEDKLLEERHRLKPPIKGPIDLTKPPYLKYKQALFVYSASRRLEKKYQFDFGEGTEELSIGDEDELINSEEWLLQTDYIANKPSEIQKIYKNRLTIIRDTLIALLPDVSDIRISTPSEKSPNPRVEFNLPDGWLLLSQLSLGYQTMTAWMVDLAAQLFKHYPNSPNPIAEPAVVLIDEIDLHLHPKWQRTIMAYLSERFVNTQFIVTAHSPLIVQAAENANIVVLKREGDSVKIHQHPQDVKGWRIDQLLISDLFDLPSARSPHYENLLNQRRQILSQAQLTDTDQAKLSELECQIGELPTAETPEDIDAMNIIRRAAELLK
ncbi:AAA family ATPase [Methylomonas sp. EFPC1]|uniref:AAA family ATPase n=1 Tax=Methylomonas sp. EFPC1 TaxID=2812647 RepID=UPI001967405D|nr:AAA family ATPase [Methylomonas sp. EFPC1]QSB01116.1 AAA family ATPase [Methylomonas sp. EFPC1]